MRTDSALQDEHGQLLLQIARTAISNELGRTLAMPEPAGQLADLLHAAGASFVTLNQQGQLRGCIGSLQARRPLIRDIQANAVAAALNDPRFAPLTLPELDITTVEVSVLSEMQPLRFNSEAHALAQLRGHEGRRALLDDLLVPPLDGALALEEMHGLAMVVGQDLGITLDMENWWIRASAKGIVQTTECGVMSVAEGDSGEHVVGLQHHPTGAQLSRTPDWPCELPTMSLFSTALTVKPCAVAQSARMRPPWSPCSSPESSA